MTPFMEKNLNLPVGDVLNIMQNRIMNESTYFGIRTAKNPLDFWIYQEILFEMKPDVIVEIGNLYGGSTLALAHFCDLLGKGRVMAIDIDQSKIGSLVKDHQRISLFEGDAGELFGTVSSLIRSEESVLVIEDSSHTYENTLTVLRKYSQLTKSGQYFIVEDSICHHGLMVGPSPGPFEAVETFVNENNDFVVDRSMENFFITWNPKGFLKRVK